MQYVRPIDFGSAVFIPAGVPHHNWRSGGQEGRR